MSDMGWEVCQAKDDGGGSRRMGSSLSDSNESSICMIESVTQGAILGCEGGYTLTKECSFGDCGGETGGKLVDVIRLRGRRRGECVMIG